MKKFFKKRNQGITLVALVITIIILLILAAISIQAITNQGLFGRANDAKRESEIANIKEQIALDIYEKQLTPPVGSITDAELETILEKYGTVNKEDGTIVGITTAKGYEILLKDIYGGKTVAETVPDGAIVNPVNDITTWLKTGGISKQYSYTTIEQVIADSTCTQSLMNNENAMKYLARSTEFADAICASETAMTSLGQTAYVDNTVLNSDLWLESICNSAYFESVLCDKVPTMTSDTEPSGKASASSTRTDSSPYKAFMGFDNSESLGWLAGTSATFNDDTYIQYKFTNPIKVNALRGVWASDRGDTELPTKIWGSNDGVNFTLIGQTISDIYRPFTLKTPTLRQFSNNNYYIYYRLTFLPSPTGIDVTFPRAGVGFRCQFYGRSLN